MSLLFDEDTDLHPLLELAVNVCCAFYEIFLEAGADTVFIGDPSSSGDLVSPAVFRDFSLPYLRKVTAFVNKRCNFSLLHICGSTKMRLEPLQESGISAFSVDAVDIVEAMRLSAGKYAVFGNVSPLSVLYEMNADGVEQECARIARQGGLAGGFCLMPGCDIAPGTPLENIRAMIRAAHSCRA